MKFLFVINPAAGTRRNQNDEAAIHSFMKGTGNNYEIVKTTGPGSAFSLAQSGVQNGFDTIIASGGDGTVNESARAVMGTESALAIIPRGSGNGLARHHGIPFEIHKCLGVIMKNKRINHDAISINGKFSVNVSGIGFDAHVASMFGKNGQRGFYGYAKLALTEYFQYRDRMVTIDDGQTQTSHPAFLLAIANSSQFGNNAKIAPLALTNDGLTDLTVVRKMSLLKMPGFAINVFAGKAYHSPYATHLRNSHFKITCSEPMPLHLDGEPAGMDSKFEINTINNAFSLIAP